jgi:hypothetical protein
MHKVCAQHLSDILSVRQIQCGIDFVQNVHWSGFEE